jgi:hypothetical protein
MADKAFITPNVLKWARESARMTEEIAAAKDALLELSPTTTVSFIDKPDLIV